MKIYNAIISYIDKNGNKKVLTYNDIEASNNRDAKRIAIFRADVNNYLVEVFSN